MTGKKYRSLYERLVANSTLQVPDNPQSCWEGRYLGKGGYAYLTLRLPGENPRGHRAARLMLQEVHDILFPFDESGHLCYNPACINPDHLEVEAQAFNLSQRRGYAPCKGPHIPTLFPREDVLQLIADYAWDNLGDQPDDCPF